MKEIELRNAAADATILLVQANAEKEANLERTKGLTPEVLQDRYYQAIGKAGTVVTDGPRGRTCRRTCGRSRARQPVANPIRQTYATVPSGSKRGAGKVPARVVQPETTQNIMFTMLFQIVIPLVAVVAAVIIALDKTVKNKTLWIIIPVAVGGFSFVATSFSVVTGGQMAVKVSPGNNVATFNGIGFVPPFTKVVKFDRRGTVDSSICLNGNEVQETCDDSIVVNGKDGGKLFVDLDLVYALDTACPTEANPNKGCLDEAARASVVSNYLSFKTNEGLKRQIRNTAKDALGEVSAKYTAVDILTEYRAQVQELAQELIATRIEQKLGIRVVTVNFTQIRSTQATEEAVDLKQRAVQEVGIAKLEQEKAAIVKETELRNAAADANILLVQANAEKEANLERTKGLTPEVLQDRYYQAIGKAGTVVTDGQTPVIIGK